MDKNTKNKIEQENGMVVKIDEPPHLVSDIKTETGKDIKENNAGTETDGNNNDQEISKAEKCALNPKLDKLQMENSLNGFETQFISQLKCQDYEHGDQLRKASISFNQRNLDKAQKQENNVPNKYLEATKENQLKLHMKPKGTGRVKKRETLNEPPSCNTRLKIQNVVKERTKTNENQITKDYSNLTLDAAKGFRKEGTEAKFRQETSTDNPETGNKTQGKDEIFDKTSKLCIKESTVVKRSLYKKKTEFIKEPLFGGEDQLKLFRTSFLKRNANKCKEKQNLPKVNLSERQEMNNNSKKIVLSNEKQKIFEHASQLTKLSMGNQKDKNKIKENKIRQLETNVGLNNGQQQETEKVSRKHHKKHKKHKHHHRRHSHHKDKRKPEEKLVDLAKRAKTLALEVMSSISIPGINTVTDSKMAETGTKDVTVEEKKGDKSVSDIEVKLGELPELPLSDEEKTDGKPMIKQEPGLVDPINLDKLIEECKEAYTHCDVHKMDRLERNLMCLQCEKLICAFCLQNSHQQHEIRSVSAMKEYFRVKDTIEDNVSILQQEQNNLTVLFSERKDLKRKIEESSQNLINDIDKSFATIRDILKVKQEQLIAYVKEFEIQNISELTKDIDKIRDLENSASRMITRAITFFSKIDNLEASDLPPKLEDVIKNCQQAKIQSLPNKEKHLPEKKFSKLLPSLNAVANICDTIHAEATKVIWSKSTKNNDMDERKVKIKSEKRKHGYLDPSENSKMFKKPKISSTQSSSSSSTSTTSSTSSLPPLNIPHSHKSSAEKLENGETEKFRRNGDKSLFESLTENIKTTGNTCKVSVHRRSVDSSSSQSSRVNSDFDDSESETSVVALPKLKHVEMKATNIETGKCLMAKTVEEDGKEEKILLGKVVGSSKMKETTQYTVNWLKGELGKDTSFDLRKKTCPVHSSYVICNFDFDHTKPMSQELSNELLLAKDYHNSRKKTRKRKSLQSVSPKKDTNKAQTSVKK